MNNEIILQGILLSDLKDVFREVIREEREEKPEVRAMSKAEAARMIGVSRPTVYSRMKREGIDLVTTENIHELKS